MILVVIFCLWCCLCSLTKSFSATYEELEEFFDSQITSKVRKKDGIAAAAVSVVHKNQTLFFKGYGYEDYSNKVRVSEDTVFGLASISKTFVAVSTMKVFEGRKHHDDFVNDLVFDKNKDLMLADEIYGNYFSYDGRPKYSAKTGVRLRHLVSHTAGFDENWLDFPTHKESLSDDLIHHMPPRTRETDEAAMYSNYAVAYLAELVALHNSNGLSYSDYLTENIFVPHHMKSTHYGYEFASQDPHFCSPQTLHNNDEYKDFEPNIQKSITARPAGAIYSSSKDMQHWMKLLLTKDSSLMSSSQYYDDLFTPVFQPSKTFPSHIDTIFYEMKVGQVTFTMHDGDLPPYHGEMALLRDHHIGISILMTANNPTVRNSIRTEFAHRFLIDNRTYCPNGTIERTDYDLSVTTCNVKYSLKTDFPRSQSDVKEKYEKKYVGCYQNWRYKHTSWVSVFFEFSQFFIDDSSFCIRLSSDGRYLVFSSLVKKKEKSFLLVEKNNDFSEDQNEFYMTYGNWDEKTDEITIRFDGLLIPDVLFRFPDPKNSKHHRYMLIGSVLGTFEYYGDETKVVTSLVVNLIFFVFLNPLCLICLCICCYCCLYPPFCCTSMMNSCSCMIWMYEKFLCNSSKRRRNRKKYQSINDGDVNDEERRDDDDDENEKFVPKKSEEEEEQFHKGGDRRDRYVSINVGNEEGTPIVNIEPDGYQEIIPKQSSNESTKKEEEEEERMSILNNYYGDNYEEEDDEELFKEREFGTKVVKKNSLTDSLQKRLEKEKRLKEMNEKSKNIMKRFSLFQKWESVSFFCGYCGVQNCTLLCLCLAVLFNLLHFLIMYVYGIVYFSQTWKIPFSTLSFTSVAMPVLSILSLNSAFCCGFVFLIVLMYCECGCRCRVINPLFFANCLCVQCIVVSSAIVCVVYYFLAARNSSFFYYQTVGL